MSGVKYNDVHMSLHKSVHTVQNVRCDTYSGSAEQTALSVLCGQRVFDLFLDIFDGDETAEVKIIINDGKLLLAGFGQDFLGLVKGDADFRCDQILGSHRFFDLLGKVCLKFQITVGDNTYQFSILSDGYAGNPELGHQVVGICQRVLR